MRIVIFGHQSILLVVLLLVIVRYAEANDFGLQASSTFYSGLQQYNRHDYAASNEIALVPNYKLPNKFRMSALAWGVKDLQGEKKFQMQDGYILVSRSIGQHRNILKATGSLRAYYPLSESSRKNTNLYTRIMAYPQVKIDLSSYGLKGLDLTYRPYASSYHYKYTRARDGRSNNQYQAGNRLLISYSFNDKVSISFDHSYARTWLHNGASKDTFSFDQSISITMAKNLDLTFGHNLGGSALAADGKNSAVEIFNNEKGQVYAGITWVL